MCVLDCAPSALKMLHSSTEFMPYVIFVGAPGMETLKQIYAERRATGGSQKNLAVFTFTFCLRIRMYKHYYLRYFFLYSLIDKAQFGIVQGEHGHLSHLHHFMRYYFYNIYIKVLTNPYFILTSSGWWSRYDRWGERPTATQIRQIHRHGAGQRWFRRNIPQGRRGTGSTESRTPMGSRQLDLLENINCC